MCQIETTLTAMSYCRTQLFRIFYQLSLSNIDQNLVHTALEEAPAAGFYVIG